MLLRNIILVFCLSSSINSFGAGLVSGTLSGGGGGGSGLVATNVVSAGNNITVNTGTVGLNTNANIALAAGTSLTAPTITATTLNSSGGNLVGTFTGNGGLLTNVLLSTPQSINLTKFPNLSLAMQANRPLRVFVAGDSLATKNSGSPMWGLEAAVSNNYAVGKNWNYFISQFNGYDTNKVQLTTGDDTNWFLPYYWMTNACVMSNSAPGFIVGFNNVQIQAVAQPLGGTCSIYAYNGSSSVLVGSLNLFATAANLTGISTNFAITQTSTTYLVISNWTGTNLIIGASIENTNGLNFLDYEMGYGNHLSMDWLYVNPAIFNPIWKGYSADLVVFVQKNCQPSNLSTNLYPLFMQFTNACTNTDFVLCSAFNTIRSDFQPVLQNLTEYQTFLTNGLPFYDLYDACPSTNILYSLGFYLNDYHFNQAGGTWYGKMLWSAIQQGLSGYTSLPIQQQLTAGLISTFGTETITAVNNPPGSGVDYWNLVLSSSNGCGSGVLLKSSSSDGGWLISEYPNTGNNYGDSFNISAAFQGLPLGNSTVLSISTNGILYDSFGISGGNNGATAPLIIAGGINSTNSAAGNTLAGTTTSGSLILNTVNNPPGFGVDYWNIVLTSSNQVGTGVYMKPSAGDGGWLISEYPNTGGLYANSLNISAISQTFLGNNSVIEIATNGILYASQGMAGGNLGNPQTLLFPLGTTNAANELVGGSLGVTSNLVLSSSGIYYGNGKGLTNLVMDCAKMYGNANQSFTGGVNAQALFNVIQNDNDTLANTGASVFTIKKNGIYELNFIIDMPLAASAFATAQSVITSGTGSRTNTTYCQVPSASSWPVTLLFDEVMPCTNGETIKFYMNPTSTVTPYTNADSCIRASVVQLSY